jgi:hypothetical protein
MKINTQITFATDARYDLCGLWVQDANGPPFPRKWARPWLWLLVMEMAHRAIIESVTEGST